MPEINNQTSNQPPFPLQENEEYRQIIGFEDYIITSSGRCYSTKRHNFIGAENKSTHYVYLALLKGNIRRNTYMHILVMEHFGPPKPNDNYEVHHLDKNTLNNDISNLRWVTHQENLEDRNPYTTDRKPRATKNDMIAVNTWFVSNVNRLQNLSNGRIAKLALEETGINIIKMQ